MIRYRYLGVDSGVTFRDGTSVRLVHGKEVDLPDDSTFVRVLEQHGALVRVVPPDEPTLPSGTLPAPAELAPEPEAPLGGEPSPNVSPELDDEPNSKRRPRGKRF